MREGSSSLNPYEFVSRNLDYAFTTDTGIEYLVYFADSAGNFDSYPPEIKENILTFGFFPRQETKGFFVDENGKKIRSRSLDPRIKDTVIHIIQEFMLVFPEKSVVSICDNNDLREQCRHELFKKWFADINGLMEIPVTKYDSEIRGAVKLYAYASIMIRNDNPLHDGMRDAFYGISDDLISKGY